jgi:hypothetical protein
MSPATSRPWPGSGSPNGRPLVTGGRRWGWLSAGFIALLVLMVTGIGVVIGFVTGGSGLSAARLLLTALLIAGVLAGPAIGG